MYLRLQIHGLLHCPRVAFKDNPRKNVAYHVFDAFRKKRFHDGMLFLQTRLALRMVLESLFRYPPTVTSIIRKDRHPDWWKNYQTFTRNQLNELMSDYGSFDILWLDGGWVKGDDIGLDDILAQARRKHPGLISVDRSIRGKKRKLPDSRTRHPRDTAQLSVGKLHHAEQ